MFVRIFRWLRGEKVLCIAALCALLTMFFVPPDSNYISYIDLRVLCLLFCLMAVITGFQHCNVFQWLAVQLFQYCRRGPVLSIILVLLPFFCAMLITNDVALLTFIPFTLLLLEEIGCQKTIIPILVLQTIAANLGSMATPVGNPQNLFLYAAFELHAADFFSVMLPLTLFSFVLLTVAACPVLPRKLPVFQLSGEIQNSKKLLVYGVLFILCLMTVFRVLPYWLLTGIVLLAVLLLDKSILRSIDYGLLATFVCFFIVSGNLGQMESVRLFLQHLLTKSTLLTSVAASQFISNVPAAILLSGFTDAWKPLLEGVNIGGLGTPIASLASLITLKQYCKHAHAKPARYLTVFTTANVAGLCVLLFAAFIL